MRRYALLLYIAVRTSALLALQYRLDFFVQSLMALVWSATAIAPLLVLFQLRESVAGWTAHGALVVVGFFVAIKGILLGVVQPSLANVVEHIRKGTLDFLLLKPADAQFMLSTSKLDLARMTDVAAGASLSGWAAARAGAAFTPAQLMATAFMLLCALAILYSLWVLVVSLSFRVVKVDNLSFLLMGVFDAARFPASIFRGALSLVFTFVLPLAVMTTYPALAILGRADGAHLVVAAVVSGGFVVASRAVWKWSLHLYTGAGG